MLKELFDSMNVQAVKAARPETLRPDGEPKHVYYLRDADGKLQRHETDPPPRAHTVKDLDSLARWIAADFAKNHENQVVWYSRTGVTIVVDDMTRRDFVTMPLEISPQMKALQALTGTKNLKDMVSFLRITLAGCVPPEIAANLRAIKYKQIDDGEWELSQGKASIGRSVKAEVVGANPIPEEILVTLPVFLGFSWPANVRCAFDCEPGTDPTFRMVPFGGEIENALRNGEEELNRHLTESLSEASVNCPVYCGTP